MPKVAKELSAIQLKKLPEGVHAVGGVPGLQLTVSATGAGQWLLRVRMGSKRREVGLGGYPAVTLAQVREKARQVREVIAQGRDPVAERAQARQALKLQQATTKTFEWCAREYLASMAGKFKNVKHTKQWQATLETYAFPIIGSRIAASLTVHEVMAVLKQPAAKKDGDNDWLWRVKPETASRLRGRIESVLSWATVHGYREGLNPARWPDNIESLLPKRSEVQSVKHQPSLPYDRMAEFMQALRAENGIAARALELAILCASRSGEVRFAKWSEFDLKAKVWTVPAERMKIKNQGDHEIPLSDQVIALLDKVPPLVGNDLVFPAPRGGALSDMTLLAVVKRMNEPDAKWVDPKLGGKPIVPHGFRSSFKTWAREQTAYPPDLSERALHHGKDAVTGAYERTVLLEKRRSLMQDWADFCQIVVN